MALQVIGAGFGRTGTLSLKLALEQLGFSKCYHMVEVFEHPDHARLFYEAATLGTAPWDELYDGYRATVDWPSSHFWRELMDYYPDAKVILSLRDPEAWYRSFSNTILTRLKWELPEDAAMAQFARMPKEIVAKRTFGNKLDDKDHIIAVYNAHNKLVQEKVPPEKLLVYRPGDGWDPLCTFLQVPLPDAPYPHTNTTEEFKIMTEDLGSH